MSSDLITLWHQRARPAPTDKDLIVQIYPVSALEKVSE